MDYQKQGKNFLNKHGIKFSAKFEGDKCPLWCEDGKHIHGKRHLITFKRQALETAPGKISGFSLSFWNSYNDAATGKLPTPYDVLSVIEKHEVGTFEDWASELGYDTDSRKAYTTYKAVYAQWLKVEKFFTPEELEELQEIN